VKEVKENIQETINESCVWVQKEMKNKTMSPEVVAAIPETLKAISNLADTLLKYRTIN
jgi:hypothetical protein